jgi:putative transposase
MSWRDFIRSHPEALAAVDFFTVEVWTKAGLMTYYVLTFMGIASRNVCIARVTLSPDAAWMKQMARNLTLAEEGFLNRCRYLLHDRDGKFCAGFGEILEAAGLKVLKLPPRSPNLNAHLERWNRSIKEECLSKLILFGERSLRHALGQYVTPFHAERKSPGSSQRDLVPVGR